MSEYQNIISRLRKAYDKVVIDYQNGVDFKDNLPGEILSHPDYKKFITRDNFKNNSANPAIKLFLHPTENDKYLDAGCSANLVNYRLFEWPCSYFGVDISPELIRAMQNFVNRKMINVGGLAVADITNLPYDDSFFDLATVIGVFEYFPIDYIEPGLKELYRVMKSGSRLVIDIPDPGHYLYEIMCGVENALNRPVFKTDPGQFRRLIEKNFRIKSVEIGEIMIKYFIDK